MRVIIAGSRSFKNYLTLKERCDIILKGLNRREVEIISGGAVGADKLGERYAQQNGHSLSIFPAQWDKFGNGAGYIRNEQMAKYASEDPENLLIVFWDGKSKGTKNMIFIAKKYNIRTEVVKIS